MWLVRRVRVGCCSVAKSCLTFCDPMDCSIPGFSLHYLPEFAQTHFHQVGDAIQLSHPLSPLSSPAFNLSQHPGLFQWVGPSRQVVSPSNEYSGLISFRIDGVDLLAIQGTLKSLLPHHSSRASPLLCSIFFMFQLSHLYLTTGKIIALTTWIFVGWDVTISDFHASQVGSYICPRRTWWDFHSPWDACPPFPDHQISTRSASPPSTSFHCFLENTDASSAEGESWRLPEAVRKVTLQSSHLNSYHNCLASLCSLSLSRY